MLHRPAAMPGLSFQWPHDDAGDWADDYPELTSPDEPSELAPPATATQSPKRTEIAPPTGMAGGKADVSGETASHDDAAEPSDDDQTKLPDWMFEVVGPRRP